MPTEDGTQGLKDSFTDSREAKKSTESKTIQERFDSIDATPLIARTSRSSLKDSILIKTMSFGLNGFFFSAYIVANSKLLAMLGDEESAAGALVSPYQSVLLGATVGFVSSIGLELGAYVGKQDYQGAGDVIRTAWVLTLGLGGISSLTMLLMREIFPLLFEAQTARAADAFFTGCSVGNIPMLMLVTNSQIAFQEGDWFIPPAVAVLLFASAIPCSYVLAFSADKGAFGVGLGGSIAQFAIFFGMQAWFLRPSYKKYDFYQLSRIPGFREKMLNLLSLGWKLSLQKLTEWGNLMLITTVIGIENNNELKATSPSAQYISLIAAVLQGVAQATGMMITRNNGSRNQAMQTPGDERQARRWHARNIHAIMQSNTIMIVLNGGIAISFYFARQPLADFFLASTTDSDTRELAETLLWVNMIGLVPNAVRVVSGGALRGWQDIMYPTLVSLFSMIIIGIPAGWGLGKAFNSDVEVESGAAWLFHARNVAILIAAFLTGDRCRKQITSDATRLSSPFPNTHSSQFAASERSSLSSRFAFFSKNGSVAAQYQQDSSLPLSILSDDLDGEASQEQTSVNRRWQDKCTIL